MLFFRKLISCLLVVMMLISVASAFAYADSLEFVEEDNALREFLKETDLKTEDIVLQSQVADKKADLLIHVDGNNLHLVSRNDGVDDSHIQLNPMGIYMGTADAVTLLRYATVTTVMQEITKAVDTMMEEAAKSIQHGSIVFSGFLCCIEFLDFFQRSEAFLWYIYFFNNSIIPKV